MNTINIMPQEVFYSTVMFEIENRLVMVEHRKESVIKIPGGTYQGPKRNWEKRDEGEDFYDNFSKKSILEKIEKTIIKMLNDSYLLFISKKEVCEIANALCYEYGDNPAKIGACVEFIEETGLIPFDLELFHKQVRGIQQFFFICESACAFSADEEKFICVKKIDDLPLDGYDFLCQDDDIREIKTIDINCLDDKQINFAHSHKEPLRNFLMKNIAESRIKS